MECGCKVEMDLDAPRRAVNNWAAVRITYCPKHAEVDNLLAALKECATTGNLASVGRGPITLVGADKRLAHIGKTAQDAIDAAKKPAARGGAA